MTRRIYDFVGLSASRSALMHLILVCIPFRFGLQPLGLEVDNYLPFVVIGSPDSMFTDKDCSDVELFLIRDFGVRLVLYQSLAWVVYIVMRQSTPNLKAFHKLLIGTSLGSLLTFAWKQNLFYPKPLEKPLSKNLFREITIFYGLAILLSSWTTLVYAKAPLEAMKWSIPGNAIFWGGVINLFIAIAAIQAVFEKGGIEQYFRDADDVTRRVKVVFVLSAWYTLAHATLLWRIRAFLTMPQLRRVCLYKVFVSALLPMLWLPEADPTPLVVDRRLTICLRISVFLTYVGGFMLAGQAEGLSSILSGEKDD